MDSPGRSRSQPPSDYLSASLLAAVLFSLDIGLTSYFNNFDGVACAMAVETANLRRLAHGNHVLYGLLGLAFDQVWRILGYKGPALLSLGVLNRLLHAASSALMFLLLRRVGSSRQAALWGSLGLAFSMAAWLYALEPQVYLLGLLGLLAASLALFDPEPSPAAAGLWHALAVGGHATHILLLPCALWRLRKTGGTQAYLLSLGAGVLAVYALGAWATQLKDIADFRLWLAGTAASGVDRSFHWNGFFNPLLWAKGLVLALWAQKSGWGGWGSAAERGFGLEAFLTFLLLGIGFVGTRRRNRPLAAALGLWLLAYLLFFSTWEPANPNYHLGDLIPFWLLVALALDLPKVPGRFFLPLAVLGLAAFNLHHGIKPITRPESNPLMAQMDQVRDTTPDNAWVATDGGSGMVYVPYFAHRRPLVLRDRPNHPEVFNLEEPVYVLPQMLENPQWGPFLKDHFKLAPAGQLYRLEKL